MKRERLLTQADIDRGWELFFGSKRSIKRIATEYDVHQDTIIGAIDSESARRWKKNLPNEVNRKHVPLE